MWVGNVAADATVSELWQFFSQLPSSDDSSQPNQLPAPVIANDGAVPGAEAADPSAPPHGIVSIFIITRSNCAFVNYADLHTLDRAVHYFHGMSLRPHDPHCPRFVCRIRRREEEVEAGVQGQRGKGLHIAYLREHEKKRKEEAKQGRTPDQQNSGGSMHASDSSTPRGDAVIAVETPRPMPLTERSPFGAGNLEHPSITADPSSLSVSSGSLSYTSTNSSLLRHPAFKERFFILKSHKLDQLEQSVQKGTWATQPHNEDVLDQAFRNSQNVFLIFSANQSGGWFGVAKMVGPIKALPTTPKTEVPITMRQTARPETIVEEGSDTTGAGSQHTQDYLSVPASTYSNGGKESTVVSPGQLTPATDEDEKQVIGDAGGSTSGTDSPRVVRKDMLTPSRESDSSNLTVSSIGPSDSVSVSSSSRDMQQLAVRALIHNLRLEERESSQKAAELEAALQSPTDGRRAAPPPNPLGRPFKVEWIVVKHVPFHATRKLRNAWRDNRQVKVSRDGTELEPNVGREMLELFKAYEEPSASKLAENGSAAEPDEDEED